MKYLRKAQLILARDGFPALLVKIKHKIFHTLTSKVFFKFFNKHSASPLPKLSPISLDTHSDSNINPQISLLIYIYSSPVYTYNCLVSLQENISTLSNCEIILINDACTDEVAKFLTKVTNVRVIQNSVKLGNIQSFNLAVAKAKGKYLIFLDQDCQITNNWLESLLLVIENHPQVGAVGSKLLYEDGKLHNAGGVTWREGNCLHYGNQADPNEPEYNYTRETDYCFLLGLLIKAELLKKLEGIPNSYTSDLYTSAAIGLAIQQVDFYTYENGDRTNYKIIYQPKSELIYRRHSSQDFKPELSPQNNFQEDSAISSDRLKFVDNWQYKLSNFLPYSLENIQRAPRRLLPQPTILIIDTLVPFYDKDSGSNRLFNIIKILLSFNFHLIFLPDYGHDQEPYTSELENLGIEVLYHTQHQSDWQKLLEPRLELIDLAWVCRPELCEKYFPTLKQKSDLKIIYDTIDLHFIRLKREAEIAISSNPSAKFKQSKQAQDAEQAWQKIQALEVKSSQSADVTIVVTEVEKHTLENLQSGRVCVVPNIHQTYSQPIPKFGDRTDILFIGGYYHNPNIDAVIWLCQKIMPLVWAIQPEIKLTLLGSNPSPAVKALANHKISVPGYIKDVEPYFLSHRLFVAPLRYGAGMKGKIGHSLSYGLPTVTTHIGAEGMHLISGQNALIADEAETFADSILKLYNNELLWQEISQNSIKAIEKYSPESVRAILADAIASLLPNWQNPTVNF